jgi:poly-gamma-glutamate synthesis protein (capsule biosynthesis protein)
VKKARLALTVLLSFFVLVTAPCGGALAYEEPVRARVVFIGDVMTHDQQLKSAKRGASWDFAPQFRRVKPLFYESLAVGNLETVFAGEKRGYAGYPSFNTPDELAGSLFDLGIRAVTLANNHILDRGASGAVRTISVLDATGISWTGLGHGKVASNDVLSLDYAGLKWAFVNYAYGSNTPLPEYSSSDDVHLNTISKSAVAEGLKRAHETSPDVIVACFHWGSEYQLVPTKGQREMAAFSVANGAGLVIGTHPHVLQPIEMTSSDRGPALVAYSLGNFVSFQRTLPRERSVVLAVDVEKKPGETARLTRVSVAPIWVSVAGNKSRRLVEVVYGGTSPKFNHAGLAASELQKARSAGALVMGFLGAAETPDGDGFYTLWDESSPDELPTPRRKKPE